MQKRDVLILNAPHEAGKFIGISKARGLRVGFSFFGSFNSFYIKRKKERKTYGSQSNKVGFYFVDTDHLGSTSTFTDANGKLVTGGEFSGASDINYLPYGEIDAKNSSGPDLSRYKFTGQKEDENTNMLFYKARYYDPELGRFLQADSKTFPDQMNGLNQYMYVNGNPTNLVDPDGHQAGCVFKFGAKGTNKYIPNAGPIWGNWTGPGYCSPKAPQGLTYDYYVFFILGKLAGATNEQILVYYYILTTLNVSTPLTEVDKASFKHDQTHSFKSAQENDERRAGKDSTHASNQRWMRRAYNRNYQNGTLLPTEGYVNRTHDRERRALGWKYGSLTPYAAWINTLATYTGDTICVAIGTTLFTVQNQYLRNDSLFTEKARYKNLNNPSNWATDSPKASYEKLNVNLKLNLNLSKLTNWSKISKWHL